MKHVFIDTNVYLNLYSYSDDDIQKLQALVDFQNSNRIRLYINSQTKDEFYRNRHTKIKETLEQFKVNASLSVPRLFDQYDDEVNGFRMAAKSLNECCKNIIDRVRQDIANNALQTDKLIKKLLHNPGEISDVIVKKAERRMLRGNLPGKKGSLGDAIHWEYLLEKVPDGEQIIIITEDKDWSSVHLKEECNELLNMEWRDKKNGDIKLYAKLASFFSKEFPEIKLDEPNYRLDMLIEDLSSSRSFDRTREILAEMMQYQDKLTDSQAKLIAEAATTNFQIYGAHEYSPSLVGERLHKLLDNKELPECLYVAICRHFPLTESEMA